MAAPPPGVAPAVEPQNLANHYPECKSCRTAAYILEDRRQGCLTCSRCGIIAEEMYIDPYSEIRRFANDDKSASRDRTSRVSDEMRGRDLGTQVGKGNRLLQQTNRRIQSSDDRKLRDGYENIEEFSTRLNLQDTEITKAKEIFNKYESKRPKTFRTKLAPLIWAILGVASKKTTYDQISKMTGISKREINKALVNLRKVVPNVSEGGVLRTAPKDLIPKICSTLNFESAQLAHQVRMDAVDFSDKAMAYLEGRRPNSIAAMAVWTIVEERAIPLEKKEVAAAAGISAATINNLQQKIAPHLDEIRRS
eukprot:TRINITY_DN10169_c0_g1_i1.p1 TRINITY_DN10169_c0_g1~~TRINITY_DN10169_c0_g1_i1.p1  ORF type:complete len:308 (-),score=49.72 TRINITY_DN10169_c0_g1_i1:47-970(-)